MGCQAVLFCSPGPLTKTQQSFSAHMMQNHTHEGSKPSARALVPKFSWVQLGVLRQQASSVANFATMEWQVNASNLLNRHESWHPHTKACIWSLHTPRLGLPHRAAQHRNSHTNLSHNRLQLEQFTTAQTLRRASASMAYAANNHACMHRPAAPPIPSRPQQEAAQAAESPPSSDTRPAAHTQVCPPHTHK